MGSQPEARRFGGRKVQASQLFASIKPLVHLAARGGGSNWIDNVSGAAWSIKNSPVRNTEYGGFSDGGHYASPSNYHTAYFVAAAWYYRDASTTTHYLIDNRGSNTGFAVRFDPSNGLSVGIGLGASTYWRTISSFVRENEVTLFGVSYDDSTGDLEILQIREDGTEDSDSSNSSGGAISNPSTPIGVGGNYSSFSAFEGSIFSCRFLPSSSIPAFTPMIRQLWRTERPWYIDAP